MLEVCMKHHEYIHVYMYLFFEVCIRRIVHCSVVSQLTAHGGGWGYSASSVEAIRFSPDAEVLLGGFGLYGGRGTYNADVKVEREREREKREMSLFFFIHIHTM